MSWTHIKHLLTALQIEFDGLFIVHEEQYVALVDMVTVLLMCMARLGFLLTHAWKPANDEPVLKDPLLLEQEPAIEVTFEHTGLGVLQHHAGAAWRWVVVGAHVLLADRAMQFWFGDARQLLAFAREKHRQRDGEAEQPSAGT